MVDVSNASEVLVHGLVRIEGEPAHKRLLELPLVWPHCQVVLLVREHPSECAIATRTHQASVGWRVANGGIQVDQNRRGNQTGVARLGKLLGEFDLRKPQLSDEAMEAERLAHAIVGGGNGLLRCGCVERRHRRGGAKRGAAVGLVIVEIVTGLGNVECLDPRGVVGVGEARVINLVRPVVRGLCPVHVQRFF